ncbi:MAG: DUF1854 domain-containing protein [Burkholderiaceae bacterium]|jgi:hypothetical protein|nr:DUF1854 domain-containing protein [Burkholderiaceae bacterium]
MNTPAFNLQRDSFGQLVLTDAAGARHTGVVAVRAFPIAAPDEGICLLDADGHERAWIARLQDLPEPTRALVAEALAQREFMPVIKRLLDVSSLVTPSVWQVQTDRGPTAFVLKGEEDIRQLAPGVLLVSDEHGVPYLIRDPQHLDRHSRKLLDWFL